MAEAVKVWVKTSVMDMLVHGKVITSSKRAIPDPSNPNASKENLNWGWARASVVEGAGGSSLDETKPVKVFIEDDDSGYNRQTLEIPAKDVAEGGVVMANIYGGALSENSGECPYPDDLIILTHLHEPAVLYALRQRFYLDRIYTATGPILLALNPFKMFPDLYSDRTMARYRAHGERNSDMGGSGGGGGGSGDEEKKEEGGFSSNEKCTPHAFMVADNSFRAMMQRLEEMNGMGRGGGGSDLKVDQSILVSGESGAGKTVTTKFMMKYLAQLSQANEAPSSKVDGEESIEKQVLNSNPILESFGNARTIRNDNSSRFGKFIEIQFTRGGGLAGASIETYLLEKVRLVHQMPSERNYHVFYEILVGFTDEEMDRYFMRDKTAEDFRMVNMSGCFERRDGVPDDKTYGELREAMNIMKFPVQEQIEIFGIPAICLHGMNLNFVAVNADESAIDKDNEHMMAVMSLLGVQYDDLNKALTTFTIKAGRETHVRSLPKNKAEKGMQGFVKALYGALFTYLVHKVNTSISVKDDSGGRKGAAKKAASIGVLDIFGFESFKVNSFEQLCINYCNETLQHQFNLFVLKNEQDEYEREAIKWTTIVFKGNEDALELIGKKGYGILPQLDDQCRAPGTTDKTFANGIYKNLKNHCRFQANFRQVGALKFGLIHYAGTVEYETAGFVEKNKDELPREATDLLIHHSTNNFIVTLGKLLEDPTSLSGAKKPPSPAGGKKKTSKPQTVGGQFSTQLRDLRQKIDNTCPHYVRCLKPNDKLVPNEFDPVIIADQLRSAGVVEAVRVSRLGYPQRYVHNTFVGRYQILALEALKKGKGRGKPVDILVDAVGRQIMAQNGQKGELDLIEIGMQVGKTKVFLKRKAFDVLETLRAQKMMDAAIAVQKIARGWLGRVRYAKDLRCILLIQCRARARIAGRLVQKVRERHNATKIQKEWRRYFAQRRLTHTYIWVRWLQKRQRGHLGRVRYNALNQIRKSIVIQKYWRRAIHAKHYQKQLQAAATLQRAVRCYAARKVLKKLKDDAKNLMAMAGERDQLRNENKALKEELEAMKLKVAEALEELKTASTGPTEEQQKEMEEREEELRNRADEAENRCTELDADVDRLSEEVLQLRSSFEEERTAKETLEQQIQTITEEKETLEAKIGTLSEENGRLSEEVEQLKVDFDDARTFHSEELQKLRDEAEQVDQAAKEAEGAAVVSALEEAQEDFDKHLQAFREETDEEMQQLRQELEEARAEVEGQRADKQAKMLEEHKERQQEREDFESRIAQLETDLRDAQESEKEDTEARTLLEGKEKELEVMKREIEEVRDQLVSKNEEIQKVKEQSEKDRDDVERLIRESYEKDEEIRVLKEEAEAALDDAVHIVESSMKQNYSSSSSRDMNKKNGSKNAFVPQLEDDSIDSDDDSDDDHYVSSKNLNVFVPNLEEDSVDDTREEEENNKKGHNNVFVPKLEEYSDGGKKKSKHTKKVSKKQDKKNVFKPSLEDDNKNPNENSSNGGSNSKQDLFMPTLQDDSDYESIESADINGGQSIFKPECEEESISGHGTYEEQIKNGGKQVKKGNVFVPTLMSTSSDSGDADDHLQPEKIQAVRLHLHKMHDKGMLEAKLLKARRLSRMAEEAHDEAMQRMSDAGLTADDPLVVEATAACVASPATNQHKYIEEIDSLKKELQKIKDKNVRENSMGLKESLALKTKLKATQRQLSMALQRITEAGLPTHDITSVDVVEGDDDDDGDYYNNQDHHSHAPPQSQTSSREVSRLKAEVDRLQQELTTTKASNPMDPAFMMKQYEELRRLTEAILDKDKEIHSLRQDIMALRERGETEADSLDMMDTASYISGTHYQNNMRYKPSHNTNHQHPPSTYRDNGHQNQGNMVDMRGLRALNGSFNSLNQDGDDDAEALRNVNNMLRQELEETKLELEDTKEALRVEKEKAKEDIKAFSEALRGVDELRQSAEMMSRELQRVKAQNRRRKERRANMSNGGYNDDDDDSTVVSVATTTLDNAAAVLHSHRRDKASNPSFWQRFTGGDKASMRSGSTRSIGFLSPLMED